MVSISFGARQAEEYNFSMTDVSGAAFVFWSLILFLNQ